MRKGLILVNRYSDIKSIENQAERIKNELANLGVLVNVVKNGYQTYLDDNCNVINNLKGYDFCVYLDKDKYTGELLNKCGVRCFNSIDSISACDDKMETFIRLSNENIKIPLTFSSPLCYGDYLIDDEGLKIVAKTLGFPLVLKLSFSSLGKGVFLVEDFKSLKALTEKYKYEPKIYQQYISSSYGQDIRIIVIGGKVVCGFKRVSKGDFRSNGALGGSGEKIVLKKEYVDVAVKVAKLLKLDYMGIDLLIGENGEPIVCEVNSNAFFSLAEEVTGVNVAKCYAEYIINTVYNSSMKE